MPSSVGDKRYVLIDGINYSVPNQAKYIFECHRGFLFFKDRKPEVVRFGRNIEWTPVKHVLHAKRSKFDVAWPLRIGPNGRENWQERVFCSVLQLPNPNLPLVDCSTFNYS